MVVYALFDLAIDSKLRGCDIVKLKINDSVGGGRVRSRAVVIQRKTGRPVQFELLEPARNSILTWLECRPRPAVGHRCDLVRRRTRPS